MNTTCKRIPPNLSRGLTRLIAVVSLFAGFAANLESQAQPVNVARNQALAERALAINAANVTRNNYNAAAPGHRINITNERTRGSNAWTTLMTKDPGDPNYATAMDLLHLAAMDLDQADMLLASIPDILDSGDRYGNLGDAKMTQGDNNFMAGNFRVAIYCYWGAKEWYRQAIEIFGRAQTRLNEVGNLITSAQNNLTAAEAIIAGLPAMPVMPPPMGGGAGVGPMGGAGPMPGAGAMPGPGPMAGPGPMPGMP